MKRLTKYLASGAADYNYPADCYGGNDCNDRAAKSAYRQTCVERLADYEDTGLTPGEVRSLWGEWNAMMRVLNSIGSYDRLRELAEADKNGRVMIAPCKVGDTAYWVHNRTVTVCRVYRIQMNRKGTFICLKSNKSHGEFRADICLGKTIFFSSEEAEKAMEVSE